VNLTRLLDVPKIPMKIKNRVNLLTMAGQPLEALKILIGFLGNIFCFNV